MAVLEPLVRELPLATAVVELLDELVWVLPVPLPSAEELGCEAVVETGILLGVTEVVTLGADVRLCEDTEEEDPV